MSKQPETKIAKKCLDYLELLHTNGVDIYWEHRSGSGGFSYKKGLPDLFIVIGPTHIECELKTPAGHLSTLQEKWKYRFTLMGTPYINPHSFEEFKSFIDKFVCGTITDASHQ